MRIHVTLHRKLFITDVARVWSLSGMCSFMYIQATFLSKPLQTDTTLKRTFTGMGSHVNLYVFKKDNQYC